MTKATLKVVSMMATKITTKVETSYLVQYSMFSFTLIAEGFAFLLLLLDAAAIGFDIVGLVAIGCNGAVVGLMAFGRVLINTSESTSCVTRKI